MDFFIRTRVLELPPQAIPKILELCNLEKPGRMDEAIDILEQWIEKQAHISKKDFKRDYLARTITMAKGSVEKSKKQIDRLCTMKTLLPQFFTKTNVKTEMIEIIDSVPMVALPVVTEDFYRVLFLKPKKITSEETILNFYQYTMILSEYLKAHDFVNGFIIVDDFRDIDIADLVTKLNPVQMQQYMSILVEGFGARLKGIYVLSQSKFVELFIKLVKQFLSQKLSSRFNVVKTVEELHKIMPKEILPVEYGGKERPFNTLVEEWLEELSSEEHVEYMKMMNKACTNENLRSTDQFNQEYMGTPGSFRRMTFD